MVNPNTNRLHGSIDIGVMKVEDNLGHILVHDIISDVGTLCVLAGVPFAEVV